MKVKAAVARSPGAPLRLEGLVLDLPQPDEIVVKLIATGVSRSDLEAIDGHLPVPFPFVPGCEGTGIVERVGEGVAEIGPGDSVIIGFDFCGRCAPCETGHPRQCLDFAERNFSGRRPDGSLAVSGDAERVHGRFFGQSSFATHLVCRAASAIKVATDAPLELLAVLGGDFLLGAGLILHGFGLRDGDALIVTGADLPGLAATMVAKARGAGTIIVADTDAGRRALASELGASVTVHDAAALVDVVKSLIPGGAQFALETMGDADARAACLASLAPGGTCAIIDPPAGTSRDFEDQLAEGRPLILSLDGHAPPRLLIPELVALHADGALPLAQIVDFFAFEHVNDALDALRRREIVKPVLRFPLGGFGELDRASREGAAEDAPVEDAPADEVEAVESGAPVRVV